jgi:catechol 2,3-dioxygenase-like lactoylglutathione lyase family enzyme
MFERIDTVFVYVDDVSKAKKWYEEVLELPVSYEDLSHPYVSFKLGETPLTLIKGEQRLTKEVPSFNFYTKDIVAIERKLKEKNVQTEEIRYDGTVHSLDFYDPFGNTLSICSF